jgi:N-acetyl-anhydromuramyl-L-alanine amidase AmpD
MRQAPSPNHGGLRLSTRGCVLHSTRGGASSMAAEYQSTLNWFANPASGVSAHIVIAADGEIAQVVNDALVAWHDPASNPIRLGVELVQPRLGDWITDRQVQSLAWWLASMSQKYGFGLTPATLPFHSETSSGRSQGKSDAYPLNAPAGQAFRVRLQAALGG